MKKSVLLVAVLLIFSSFTFAQSTNIKIGYVDSGVILNQYPPAVKAQSDLDALVQKWNKQVDSMTVDLQQAYQTYQKQAETMTPEKRTEVEQTLVRKQQTLDQFRQSKYNQQNGELYQKQNALMGPIKERVFKAIDQVAKDQGMNFVFDKAGDVVLLYADSEFDITYKVLDRLNREK